MPIPKPNLSSASVDALLQLRDEIAEVLTPQGRSVTRRAFEAWAANWLQRESSWKLAERPKGRRQIPWPGSRRGAAVCLIRRTAGYGAVGRVGDRSGNTWAGRGAQPVWLREKLKAGAKLEDFAVHKTPKKSKKHRRAKR